MAGAAISPPTIKAVEPSRSFFIFSLSYLIRDWYVPKANRRIVDAQNAATHCPRQYDRFIKHRAKSRVKKWSCQRLNLPAPVASLSQFGLFPGLFDRALYDFQGRFL